MFRCTINIHIRLKYSYPNCLLAFLSKIPAYISLFSTRSVPFPEPDPFENLKKTVFPTSESLEFFFSSLAAELKQITSIFKKKIIFTICLRLFIIYLQELSFVSLLNSLRDQSSSLSNSAAKLPFTTFGDIGELANNKLAPKLLFQLRVSVMRKKNYGRKSVKKRGYLRTSDF